MSLPHLWHQLEGQSAQRLGSCRCQFPYNIHNTQTMRTALEDGQIPKDIFNDQLALGKRPQAHPQLRYKDICERDMKVLDINTEIWEDTAANRNSWRCLLKTLLKTGEEKILILNLAERGEPGRRHTDPANPPPPPSQATTSALCAAETTTPALVLPDTDNAVLVTTPRPPRPQYPWSTSTEGGLLRDTLKTKQKRLRAQWNRSLFLLEFFLCLNWLVHIIS